MASERNGTLYVGMTNDIVRRVQEHKSGETKGFTNKYKVNLLVYFEEFNYIHDAINREKQIKNWTRKWKLELIENLNPDWLDLYNELIKDFL